MLKLIQDSLETEKFHSLKCGEIYYLPSSVYSVICCFCGQKICFDEFQKHFQENHLFQEQNTPWKCVNETEKEECISRNKKNALDSDCEGNELVEDINFVKVDTEDEQPIEFADLEEMETICVKKENYDKLGIAIDIKDYDMECSSLNEDEDDDDLESCKVLPFPCSNCDRSYKSKRSLQNHLRINHNPLRPRKAPKLKYKCEECGELFRTLKNLRGHKWKHTGIICDVCGKTFTQTGNMMRHKIRHTGVKAHKCAQCDNSFFTEKELRSHMLRHTGLLPVICEVCGRRCRDRGVLTAHMRRHTGERPAKCEVCGKSFFSFHDLNIHAVAHTTERPFVCDICGSTFQRKKALRVHKQLHNKDRKYLCKVCGKGFAQSGGLLSHMRTHDTAELNKNVSLEAAIKIDINNTNL